MLPAGWGGCMTNSFGSPGSAVACFLLRLRPFLAAARFRPCPAVRRSWLALAFQGTFEFAPQLLAVGQVKLVFRDEKLVVDAGECVLDQGVILRGAEQDAEGRVIVRGHHVASIPAHIGVELADV